MQLLPKVAVGIGAPENIQASSVLSLELNRSISSSSGSLRLADYASSFVSLSQLAIHVDLDRIRLSHHEKKKKSVLSCVAIITLRGFARAKSLDKQPSARAHSSR
jgi:hypothetical protein